MYNELPAGYDDWRTMSDEDYCSALEENNDLYYEDDYEAMLEDKLARESDPDWSWS